MYLVFKGRKKYRRLYRFKNRALNAGNYIFRAHLQSGEFINKSVMEIRAFEMVYFYSELYYYCVPLL